MSITKPLATAGNKFMGATVSVQLPHLAAVILAGVAGALQALDQSTLAIPARWHAYLGLGLVFLSYFAIRPLIGTTLRDALPLPNWLLQLVTAIVAIATVIVGAGLLPDGSLALTILSGLLTVLVALGFGPRLPGSPAPQALPSPPQPPAARRVSR